MPLAPRQLTLDAVQLRIGPVEPPPVPQQRDKREERDPDRPEHPVRPACDPDDRADDERHERAAAVLNQPAPELAAAAGDRGALLGAAHGKPRQVLPEGLELALGTGPIDGL